MNSLISSYLLRLGIFDFDNFLTLRLVPRGTTLTALNVYMHQKNNKNKGLIPYGKIWLDLLVTLKICEKSKFDQNQLKLATQHKNMRKYYKN